MTPIPTELRELLERIVAGDVGRMIYAKLATGQATETDDGKAWLELRALLATPPADAADMGGQAGEEVEVVAHLMRPDFMEPYVSIRRDCSGVFVEQLMTVAQHQRIVAALSAQQSAHVSVPRELLEQIAIELEHDNDRYFLGRELRALLNGGEA